MSVVIPAGFMHVIQPFLGPSASKEWTTTYAIQTTAPGSAITEADDVFRGAWRSLTDTSFQMLPAVGYYRTAQGDLTLHQSATAAQAGLSAKASAPPNTTFIVSKRTPFVGRKHRGRCFIPLGVTEASVDELGNVLPATVATLQGAADAWLASASVAVNFDDLFLLHSDISLTPSIITSLVVQPVVRTQRRRLP